MRQLLIDSVDFLLPQLAEEQHRARLQVAVVRYGQMRGRGLLLFRRGERVRGRESGVSGERTAISGKAERTIGDDAKTIV